MSSVVIFNASRAPVNGDEWRREVVVTQVETG